MGIRSTPPGGFARISSTGTGFFLFGPTPNQGEQVWASRLTVVAPGGSAVPGRTAIPETLPVVGRGRPPPPPNPPSCPGLLGTKPLGREGGPREGACPHPQPHPGGRPFPRDLQPPPPHLTVGRPRSSALHDPPPPSQCWPLCSLHASALLLSRPARATGWYAYANVWEGLKFLTDSEEISSISINYSRTCF